MIHHWKGSGQIFMDYTNETREELIKRIEELTMLNNQLLSDREQEDRLDFAWSGNLGHWYYNIKTGSVVFNPLKVESLGYQMSELPNHISYKFFTEKVHPEDYENTMNMMRQNMVGLIPVYECEYRIQAKDGSWKWFYDRGKVTKRDPLGKPLFAAGIVFDITAKKEKELNLTHENKLLEVQSHTDALTGIKNRGAIMEELEKGVLSCSNQATPFSIAIFDIDFFKVVNDNHGHVVGDQIIKSVAQIISKSIREIDSVGRYGGEEFLVIFPNTSPEQASIVSERIRANVETFEFDNHIKITVSGGIATYKNDGITTFVDRADQKMYDSKHHGRNRVECE